MYTSNKFTYSIFFNFIRIDSLICCINILRKSTTTRNMQKVCLTQTTNKFIQSTRLLLIANNVNVYCILRDNPLIFTVIFIKFYELVSSHSRTHTQIYATFNGNVHFMMVLHLLFVCQWISFFFFPLIVITFSFWHLAAFTCIQHILRYINRV